MPCLAPRTDPAAAPGLGTLGRDSPAETCSSWHRPIQAHTHLPTGVNGPHGKERVKQQTQMMPRSGTKSYRQSVHYTDRVSAAQHDSQWPLQGVCCALSWDNQTPGLAAAERPLGIPFSPIALNLLNQSPETFKIQSHLKLWKLDP